MLCSHPTETEPLNSIPTTCRQLATCNLCRGVQQNWTIFSNFIPPTALTCFCFHVSSHPQQLRRAPSRIELKLEDKAEYEEYRKRRKNELKRKKRNKRGASKEDSSMDQSSMSMDQSFIDESMDTSLDLEESETPSTGRAEAARAREARIGL